LENTDFSPDGMASFSFSLKGKDITTEIAQKKSMNL
jgi:hypothetical protein